MTTKSDKPQRNGYPIQGLDFSQFGYDFAASIVVFLVALPLCMGIAIACNAPVSAGLITGIVGGLVAGSLAGCPLQVSGPAAGLTVIVYDVIMQLGLEMLGLVVFFTGVLQLLAGIFRLGQWFRAVSPAVVQGMLAGIGVLIFASQFHVMLDDTPKSNGVENLVTIPASIQKAFRGPILTSADDREERRELLQSLGEIHREQAAIEEAVLERIPDHQAVADLEGVEPDVPLEDLASRQQSQLESIDTVLTQAEETFASQPDKVEKIQEEHQEAAEMFADATAALEANDASRALRTQQQARAEVEELQASMKNHDLAALIGVITIAVLLLWTPLTPKTLKVIPAPLVAVIVATIVATVWQMPVLSVEVPDSLVSELRFPTMAILRDAPWEQVATMSLLMAAVASAETLLCATAVDQMHTGVRTRYDKELFGQGVGNTICGLLGVLPMTGVIVRSGANVQAGAKTRLSAIMHGVWLLIFVAAFSPFLRAVPTSCLAAILVYTGYKLVNVKKIRTLWEYGWGEVFIYAATVTVIVVEDLLTGVIAGILLAAAKLLYTFSHLKARLHIEPEKNRVLLDLDGAATFVRLPKLAMKLERIPAGSDAHIDITHLSYIDHACLELLSTWSQQHEAGGGKTTLDWDVLHSTMRNGSRSRGTEYSEISNVA